MELFPRFPRVLYIIDEIFNINFEGKKEEVYFKSILRTFLYFNKNLEFYNLS